MRRTLKVTRLVDRAAADSAPPLELGRPETSMHFLGPGQWLPSALLVTSAYVDRYSLHKMGGRQVQPVLSDVKEHYLHLPCFWWNKRGVSKYKEVSDD